ncbi:MAG: hypothetical protein AB7S26_23290 [Sandaracinaceae bacterium]
MRSVHPFAVSALTVWLIATPACADEPSEPAATEDDVEAEERRDAHDEAGDLRRREVPDYDGRPDPGPSPEESLLWIPRILTSPLYVISEYLIRAPLGWLTTELERSRAFEFLFDVFVFGPDRSIGVFPTAFFDFGLAPSAGLYAFWDGFLFDQNHARLHAATGGEDWLTLTVTDTWRPEDDVGLTLRLALLKRPDQQLGVIENPLPEDRPPLTRYGIETVEAGARFEWRPWSRNVIGWGAKYRGVGFIDERYDENPSIGEVYGPDQRPGLFDSGFSSVDLDLHIVVDSRPTTDLLTGGVRAVGDVVLHVSPSGPRLATWINWSLELGLATDVLGSGRVLSVTAAVQGVSPAGEAVVPFIDLPELGGVNGPLPGFQFGYVRGRSIAAVRLGYEWPLFALLDGTLHWGVGNVFGDTFTDFDVELLRMSFGVSLAPRWGGDHLFEMGLAFGTAPFRDGAGIESVRFFVGARNGL